MACGGGNPNKIGPSSWMNSGSVQWNSRREAESEEWNPIGHNISNNLEWQSQRKTPGNNNIKNKRKSNASKNSRGIEMEDAEDEFINCNFPVAGHQSSTNYPRTKFTMQNGVNGTRKKRTTYHEPNGEGDKSSGPNARTQSKVPWPDLNEHRSSMKNVSNEVNEPLSQMPNANQVLERLMEIRDYMSQMAAMIETLQKSGDHRVLEQLTRLQRKYSDLQSSEQQLVKLLDKISKSKKGEVVKFSKLLNHLESQENECLNELHQTLELQPMPIRSSLDGKSQSSADDSDNSDSDEDEFVDQEEVATQHLNQDDNNVQNPEVYQQAKRSKLLKKVAQSQEKLKALQDQQMGLLVLQRKAENQLAQAKAMRHTNTQMEDQTPVEMETAAALGLQDDLESLQGRLDALKDLYDNRQRAESMGRIADPELKMDEGDFMTEMQRQELHDKLQDLQEKKRCMDNLLHELKTLQTLQSSEGVNNEMFAERIKEGAGATAVAKQTMETAQDMLELINPDEKMMKLQEMKVRLKQLQDQLAIYKLEQPNEMEDCFEHSISNIPCPPKKEQLRNQNESRVLNKRPHKKDNVSREQVNELKVDNRQGGDVEECLENENEMQSQFRKLQVAKDKLSKMQDLLSALKDKRQLTDDKIGIVHKLLLESLDKEDDHASSYTSQGLSLEQFREIVTENVPEHLPKERKRRSGFLMTPQEQQMNIDQLLEESHRLLDSQDQFNINQVHPNNIDLPLPANKSFEHIRKSEPREFAASGRQKHNEEKESASSRRKEDHANKNSSQKVSLTKHNDAESSSGELVTSNQEIWSEVRQQFILKEELRQKKRELEELMKKDKGKMNSRNQDNMSDNVSYSNKSDALGLSFIGTEGTTVATWGGSTQGNLDEDQEDQNSHEEIEENEVYSSEDVAISTANATRNDTRTPIRAKGRSPPQVDGAEQNSGVEKSVSLNVTTSTKGSVEFKDTRKMWDKVPLTRDTVRNWNTRSNLRRSECSNEGGDEACAGMRTEVNPQMNWQQQTSQFMQHLEQTNMLHHSIIRDQNSLANLLQQMNTFPNSSSEEATRPQNPEVMQLVTHQLQHQQQLVNLHQCHHLLYLQQLSMQQVQRQLQQMWHVDVSQASGNESGEQHPLIPPSWFPNNQMQQSSVGASGSEMGNNLFAANFITPDHQTLNNQVAPGIRTNNYWDNFRSYSRQNLLSATSSNKGCRDAAMMNPPVHEAPMFQNPGQNRRVPRDVVGPTTEGGRNSEEMNSTFARQAGPENSMFQPICQRVLPPNSRLKKNDKANENCHQIADGNALFRCLEQSRAAKNEFQKFGSGPAIYGANTASASSSAVSFDSAQEGNLRNSQDARGADDRNLFETLRESIYSEVAVLISQNETRPHFLIRMFRELQKLNSDYLRQNALVSLSELISHLSSIEQTSPGSPVGRRTWTEQMSNSFELGASESVATSDEEEVRTRLSKVNKPSQKMEMPSTKAKVSEPHYDYAETIESTLTVTSPSVSGEGVTTEASNQHQKATKEVNQQMSSSLNNTSLMVQQSLCEEAANSAEENESIKCTISCAELTSKQLDDKIQVIMLEVIPFLKAHLEDVCSPKLLSCLQQLVISLATQRDVDAEFANLLRKRLTSALQTAHAKYTGKKLRDCGESLLVDTSEALVAELACVHLLHNVDSTSSARNRSKNYRSISQNFAAAGTSAETKKENVFSARGNFLSNFDVEATDADECMASKMEEDELGRSRDDAMATNCDTFDNEDASRTSSINSFKDSLQAETPKLNELLPELPCEGAAASIASMVVKEFAGSRSESSHYQHEMTFNEQDNENEDGAEDNLDLAEADQPQNFVMLERVDVDDQEGNLANADATRAEDDQQERLVVQNAEARGANGGVEQGLDEVPIKLLPLFQRELNNQMAEEESANNLIDEIINEAVESELAENVSFRQPENQ